jgi:ankyrin repeat protein
VNNNLQNATAHLLLETAKEYIQFYLEIENKDKKTALSIACEYGNINLVRILLLYGAYVHNSMPIHMAVKSGNVDIVKLLLLEYQVQLTSTNISSETPLHIACQYNRTDVLQVLINYQNEIIDLEVRDYQGYTPLLTASYFNHQDCIRILLINRADITAIDNNGKNICKYYLNSILNEKFNEHFLKVHICVEQHCQDALQKCLQWIKEDIGGYSMFIQGDRHENTVLHAGIYHSIREIRAVTSGLRD